MGGPEYVGRQGNIGHCLERAWKALQQLLKRIEVRGFADRHEAIFILTRTVEDGDVD
jgi:hypothetical protein